MGKVVHHARHQQLQDQKWIGLRLGLGLKRRGWFCLSDTFAHGDGCYFCSSLSNCQKDKCIIQFQCFGRDKYTTIIHNFYFEERQIFNITLLLGETNILYYNDNLIISQTQAGCGAMGLGLPLHHYVDFPRYPWYSFSSNTFHHREFSTTSHSSFALFLLGFGMMLANEQKCTNHLLSKKKKRPFSNLTVFSRSVPSCVSPDIAHSPSILNFTNLNSKWGR